MGSDAHDDEVPRSSEQTCSCAQPVRGKQLHRAEWLDGAANFVEDTYLAVEDAAAGEQSEDAAAGGGGGSTEGSAADIARAAAALRACWLRTRAASQYF